ncbi:hypothetical protein Csa_023667, partial [Cucumis sativus]
IFTPQSGILAGTGKRYRQNSKHGTLKLSLSWFSL